MILYLDTSAFLKLYLEEPESGLIRAAIAEAELICTHSITYAEMRAAFSRATRMNRLAASELPGKIREFEADWLTLEIIEVDEALIRRAGELAESCGLRGYDSVHLAAAVRAFEAGGRAGTFMFAAFDKNLCTAACALGLTLPG